jgi:hypothetical protein
MATDNTPPRLKLIATIAVIVVTTLVSLEFVFKSYYGYMTDEAQREKIAPTLAKEEQATTEKASFAAAKMPIDQAMAQLKSARSELIEPKPSDDLGAMTGWSKLPKQPPLPAPTTPIPVMAPGDIGDAGAHPNLTGDAGSAAMAADAGAGTAPVAPAAKDAGAHAGH